MPITVKALANDLFEAQASPPHVKSVWSTVEPISARKLVAELKSRGAHQQDIGDAMYEQDPNWIEKL